MSEVQDEEHWLYGDDKEESENAAEVTKIKANCEAVSEKVTTEGKEDSSYSNDVKSPVPPHDADSKDDSTLEKSAEDKEDQEKNDDDDDAVSSSDDEPTVTIGKIVKQPDIIRPPPPTHRAAPSTGVKEDDFETPGKINGIPVEDFSISDLEEKPWQKPGSDLSDYFNYGFTEQTWVKYCEKQKSLRVHDSAIGLGGLGIGTGRIPVSIINENSKYGGMKKFPFFQKLDDDDKKDNSQGNSIQVMTADRRTYSSKVLSNQQNYGNTGGGEIFTNYNYPPPFFGGPPPNWLPPPNIPPPGWGADGGPNPPSGGPDYDGYFEEKSREKEDSLEGHHRSRDRSHGLSRDRSRERSRDRESRHRRRRSRSRSRSRHHRHSRSRSKSHSKSRSRSKSRSPHRHKRKRSKRERE